MGNIVTSGVIEYWCPVCKHNTAGIVKGKSTKRTCPLCGRELWQCQGCKDYTFGVITNTDQCHHCGTVRDP